jgi:hypothetical protein
MQKGQAQTYVDRPFVARISVSGKQHCTGVVVADRWVLTASHCVREVATGKAIGPLTVELRRTSVSDNSSNNTWTSGVSVIDTKATVKGNVLVGDVALLHTNGAMPSWARAIPVALSRPPVGTTLTTWGWGRISRDGQPSSYLMKSADGDVSVGNCPTAAFTNVGQLCLHGATSRLWAGDSGGPATWWVNGFWQIVSTFSSYPDLNHSAYYGWVSEWPAVGSPVPYDTRGWIERTIGAPQVASNTILRDAATGTAYLLGSDGYRRWIPTGGDYQCLVSKGSPVSNSFPMRTIQAVPEAVGQHATCTPTAPPPQTWPETTGGAAHTWTNYTNAGGIEGPTIPAFTTVQIACKVTGFRVADGNTWWYRIASSPWSRNYYVSADAFYNNGATSGSLHGTPFVDPAVADC